MDKGLLMGIGDRTLEDAAVIAGNRLYARTGDVANTAMVHPALLPEGPQDVQVRLIGHLVLMRFRANPWVAMGHVWVGVEEVGGRRQEAGGRRQEAEGEHAEGEHAEGEHAEGEHAGSPVQMRMVMEV